MPRIELTEDGSQWAELREASDLTNGQRKPFMRLLASLPTTLDPDGQPVPNMDGVDGDTILDLGEKILTAFLVDWSYGPLPSDNPAALDDIPAIAYDKLQIAAGELVGDLAPKVERPTP